MKSKRSNEQFIEEATKIHGNTYDYSKTVYKYTNDKVVIICKEHGEFLKTPKYHLFRKAGCQLCSFQLRGNARKNTQEQFIHDAIKIHGEKYDYSKVVYNGCDNDVIIICKTHCEFIQTPYHHLKRQHGCAKCGFISTSIKQTKPQNEFIEDAIKVHGDKYDYSKVEYIKSSKPVTIICKIHDEFLQAPSSHLTGAGCPKCVGRNKSIHKINQEFIDIHGDKYDYSKVEYINAKTPVIIICKIHGEFIQTPKRHLRGCGCNKCGKMSMSMKQTKPQNEFIEDAIKVHGDNYDYSKVEYINAKTTIIVICKNHGDFYTTPDAHISKKSGCPKCKYKTENQLFNFLKIYHPDITFQPKYEWCINTSSKTNKFLPFDFCIETHKIIIELDGEQHFKQVMDWNPPEVTQITDKYKMKCANENGYYVIRLLQLDVRNNKNNWDEKLLMVIKDIINGNKRNCFICGNNEYEPYL